MTYCIAEAETEVENTATDRQLSHLDPMGRPTKPSLGRGDASWGRRVFFCSLLPQIMKYVFRNVERSERHIQRQLKILAHCPAT